MRAARTVISGDMGSKSKQGARRNPDTLGSTELIAGPVNPSLLAICRAMGSGLQLNEVLDTILELTMREVQAQQGSILLFDEHQDRLEMLASYGLPHEIVEKGYIARKGSIAELVIDH